MHCFQDGWVVHGVNWKSLNGALLPVWLSCQLIMSANRPGSETGICHPGQVKRSEGISKVRLKFYSFFLSQSSLSTLSFCFFLIGLCVSSGCSHFRNLSLRSAVPGYHLFGHMSDGIAKDRLKI